MEAWQDFLYMLAVVLSFHKNVAIFTLMYSIAEPMCVVKF